jgi:glycosyltransferase involved in cell wall biosynthesis
VEKSLRGELPDAFYLGWVEQKSLPALYLACDLLLLPSRFDTFSCVVIEAMCCGLPVVAYNAKGPKDILEDSVNGFLVETREEMAGAVIRYYLDPEKRIEMKQEAFRRADSYRADTILNRLLRDTGIIRETVTSQ